MKPIYTFLCLFLLSGVLSDNTNASYQVTTPPPAEMVYRDCATTFNDPVLWNNELPDTESWTPHCWPLVYHEDGKWYFDIKKYGKILLQRDQTRKRMALQEERKKLWLPWAEQRIVHQMKYGKYNSW